MALRFLRLARWSSVPLGGLLAVTALGGACGGGSSAGPSDSGPGFDGTYESGSSSGGSGSGSGSGGSGSGSGSSSGGSGSSGGSSSGGADSGNDAPYEFDGFAHLDGYSEASYCPDDDGDGWTVCGGDCNDHDSLINPCAFDTNDPNDPVGTDGIDNDCDGFVDNLRTCETGLASGFDPTPADYVHAADLCDNALCPRLVNSLWYGPTIADSKRITEHMGNSGDFVPRTLPPNPAGAPAATNVYMSFLSNGTAEDDVDVSSYQTCNGTDFGVTYVNPMPLNASQNVNPCGTGVSEADGGPGGTPIAIHDYTELRMTIKAPINAGSYSFDFAFFSEEYPVYVCQGFNDTFLAVQTSSQYPDGQQIAYDANGHRINVNNAFFQDCNSCTNCVPGYDFTVDCNANSLALLDGTGYEELLGPTSLSQCNLSHGSGGTDWLTTTSPVQPGEQFTLSWIIFDEHDGILDSSIILDHFHWHSTTLGSPVTAR
jgi:hypothetical protein